MPNEPKPPNEPEVEYPAPENSRSPLKTWRILFLDTAENILPLKDACKECGYEVVGATTIEDAWLFLDGKDHADVIVCAPYLEDESLFKFLKGVRDSEVHRKAMFLVLSLEPTAVCALLDRSTARAAMALGADAYVIMPGFDAVELIAQIRLLLPEVPMLQQSATAEEKRRSE